MSNKTNDNLIITLVFYIIWSQDKHMKLFKRENYLKKIRGFYDADDLVKVITGVRRSGKSKLMDMFHTYLNEKNKKSAAWQLLYS